MKAPDRLYSDNVKLTIDNLNQQTDLNEYFRSLVTINLDTFETYYQMILAHTAQSFKIAWIVGLLGFGLIAVGVALAYNDQRLTVVLLAGLSGILAELIAAVQFWLYSKTVQQVSEYRDSLIDQQHMLLSVQFANTLTTEENKVAVATRILDYLHHSKISPSATPLPLPKPETGEGGETQA